MHFMNFNIQKFNITNCFCHFFSFTFSHFILKLSFYRKLQVSYKFLGSCSLFYSEHFHIPHKIHFFFLISNLATLRKTTTKFELLLLSLESFDLFPLNFESH